MASDRGIDPGQAARDKKREQALAVSKLNNFEKKSVKAFNFDTKNSTNFYSLQPRVVDSHTLDAFGLVLVDQDATEAEIDLILTIKDTLETDKNQRKIPGSTLLKNVATVAKPVHKMISEKKKEIPLSKVISTYWYLKEVCMLIFFIK